MATYFDGYLRRDELNALFLATPPRDMRNFWTATDSFRQLWEDPGARQQYTEHWLPLVRADLVQPERPSWFRYQLIENAVILDADDLLVDHDPPNYTSRALIYLAGRHFSKKVLLYFLLHPVVEDTFFYVLNSCIEAKQLAWFDEFFSCFQADLNSERMGSLARHMMEVDFSAGEKFLDNYVSQITSNEMYTIASYGSLESFLRHLAHPSVEKIKGRYEPSWINRLIMGAVYHQNQPIVDFYLARRYGGFIPELIQGKIYEDEGPEEAERNRRLMALFYQYEAKYPYSFSEALVRAFQRENETVIRFLVEKYPQKTLSGAPQKEYTQIIIDYLSNHTPCQDFWELEKLIPYDRNKLADWARQAQRPGFLTQLRAHYPTEE